ncbi:glycosyltransferase [Cellulosilyticum sp. ST5]|uniref:glycosyltransferase n=1 Tax=Cellulosilyticum sp. ST5 TaxID=3055805 RepID=UPI0039776036
MTVVEVISIIVPIYNIEKYLSRSIESLINQTYPHLEIILVNDGSKDNSLAICEAYAKKDRRIVVIDKVNEGVSIARNTGLEAATGTYVGFIDPDDWVEPTMYEKLYKQIKKWDSPVCLCNYFKDTKKKSSPKVFSFKDEVLEDKVIIEKLVNNMVGMPDLMPTYVCVMGCVWRGLFKKEFLDTNQLRFAPGVSIMEDLVFMVQTLLKCQSVAIEQGVYYHYVQNPSSTLHTYNKKLWEDQIKVYELLEKSFIESHLEEEMRNRLDFRYIGMVLSAIKNETYMKKDKDSDLKDTVAHIKQICQDEKLKFVLERVKPIQVSEKKPAAKEGGKRLRAIYSDRVAMPKKPKEKKKGTYITKKTSQAKKLEKQAKLSEAKRKPRAKKSLSKAKHYEVE